MVYFHEVFPSNLVYICLLSHTRHMSRPCHSGFIHPSNCISRGKHREVYHYAILSTILLLPPSYVQISSSVPYSRTPSASGLPLMWDTRFYTHTKQQEENIILYLLIFIFWGNKCEHKIFWTVWQQAFPEFNLQLCMLCWFGSADPKYLNFITFFQRTDQLPLCCGFVLRPADGTWTYK